MLDYRSVNLNSGHFGEDSLTLNHHISRQISIIPKPKFKAFWGGIPLRWPPFGVTSAEVVIICLEKHVVVFFSVDQCVDNANLLPSWLGFDY